MPILKEPLVWFVVFALVSLLITFTLFKGLESSAQIKRKDYLFKGGIAGFLAVFFLAWYTFYPTLQVPVGEIAPSAIPSGFKAYSDKTFAIAIPKEYEPRVTREFKFDGPSDDNMFFITVIGDVPLERFASLKGDEFFDQETQQGLSKLMPAIKMVGPAQPAPIQGKRGFTWPIEITIPDDPVFKEERGTKQKGFYHAILDDQSRTVFVLAYDDSEISRKILSTLTLPKD